MKYQEEVNRALEFRALKDLQLKANGKQFSLKACPKCHTNELLFLDVEQTQVRCLQCGTSTAWDPVSLIAHQWGTTEQTPAVKYLIRTKENGNER